MRDHGLRALLAALLDEIAAGQMVATATTRARIEGAIVALDVLAGEDPAAIVERLTDQPRLKPNDRLL